jgi:hypothetical protein
MPSTYPIILYDNILIGSSLSAAASVAGYSIDNLDDYRSYTYWQAASSGTVRIFVHCTAARGANTLGIVGHDVFSKNATISVQHFSSNSATDADWATALAGFVPTDDYALMKAITPSTDLWWKITIQCSTMVNIACILLGNKLQFPSMPQVPLQPYSIGVEAETNQSKTGHILGSVIRYRPLGISHRMAPVESNYPWFTSTYWNFWLNHGSEMKPFLYAMDLDSYPDDVFWTRLADDSAYSLPMEMAGRVEAFTLNLVGMLE